MDFPAVDAVSMLWHDYIMLIHLNICGGSLFLLHLCFSVNADSFLILPSSVLLAAVLFAAVWSITEKECLPGGNLFGITVLFICAVTGGKLVALVRLPKLPPFPPLLGKLYTVHIHSGFIGYRQHTCDRTVLRQPCWYCKVYGAYKFHTLEIIFSTLKYEPLFILQ